MSNTQLVQANVLVVTPGDHGFTFMVNTPEGLGGVIKLYTREYDEDAKSYVPSEESTEGALEVLKKFGIESTDADAVTALQGQTLELYYSEDQERFSFTPIREFERFDYIDVPASKALRRVKDAVPMSLRSEFDGIRFNFGVDVDVKGETKRYRVSQIVIDGETDEDPETVISVKYITKEINSYLAQLENGGIPAESVGAVKDVIKQLTERARQAKIEELSGVFGQPILEMIEAAENDGEVPTFPVELEVASMATDDQPVYFLRARLIKE